MKSQTEQSLVDAINANPADFDTRRVYVDWLEERGENSHGWRLLNACGRVPWQWPQQLGWCIIELEARGIDHGLRMP